RYGDGPNQTDRLELYNLKEDIGERINLAARFPDRAAELNRLIDDFLNETKALVPKPNPNYVPSFLGWTGNDQLEIRRENDLLILDSRGPDPQLRNPYASAPAGRLRIEITMRAEQDGRCDLYYATRSKAISPETRLSQPMVGDGRFHVLRYEIELDEPLRQLRIDPLQSPGHVEIDRVRMIQWREPTRGVVGHDWEF
ncbi:MAG: hypothetical protein D6741_17045, partial [Planctomycetota bacterium]